MNITTHGDKPRLALLEREKRILREAAKLARQLRQQVGFPEYAVPAIDAEEGLRKIILVIHGAESEYFHKLFGAHEPSE